MIHEIFNFHYTTHMHPLRLTPLTHDELSRGMPEDAINKYLSLVKDLYDACFFDVNAPFTPPTREEKHQRHLKQETIYNALIKHLFMFDTISDAVYSELYEGMVTNFDLLERPDSPDRYVSDSFDDFRLAFERNLVESDQCIDMRFEYLADRYGFGFGTHSAEDALMIFRIQDAAEQSLCEISYWEVRHLLSRIQKDISRNSEEQRRLDADFCHPKHPHFVTAPQTYATPKTIHEWYTIKRALEVEAGYLLQVEELVKDVFTSMDAPDKAAGSDLSLYIYKGKIICHQRKHPIVPATAILYDSFGNEIQLDIEFCPVCKRYMLNYVSFEHYRERHGVLIGKLKMVTASGPNGELLLAQESPLKLCGYNVSQADGLSSSTRQFILAKIIHDGIMSKLEVIHYIESFISRNGSKAENYLAVEKWHEDLAFVHRYDIRTQPRVFIGAIKPY